jgi:hypothetical protein
MINVDFAKNLAAAIGDLSGYRSNHDLGQFLALTTESIAEMVYKGTPGIRMEDAQAEAAIAVETACKRDGIELEAKVALLAFSARK